MTKIGKNIKKIRNVRGLSQQAFADLFSLTRGNISSYEEFRAEPKIEIIVKIANYFGIPLEEFIQKELSVNDLLHYNTKLVLDTNKLKIAQQLVEIPYLPVLYIPDYTGKYNDPEFISQLPVLTIPSNSRFRQLAIELDNPDNLPAGFPFRTGDILIFEEVVKENIHRIDDKFGMSVSSEGIQYGIYKQKNKKMILALNDLVTYPFDLNENSQYWILRASIVQTGG